MNCGSCLFFSTSRSVCDAHDETMLPIDGCEEHWPIPGFPPGTFAEFVLAMDLFLEHWMTVDGSETNRIGFWASGLLSADEDDLVSVCGPASAILEYEVHVSFKRFDDVSCAGIGIITVYDEEGEIVFDEHYDEAFEVAGVLAGLAQKRGWL
jgi:hypothetical protein